MIIATVLEGDLPYCTCIRTVVLCGGDQVSKLIPMLFVADLPAVNGELRHCATLAPLVPSIQPEVKMVHVATADTGSTHTSVLLGNGPIINNFANLRQPMPT
jgi:hypothetical protein